MLNEAALCDVPNETCHGERFTLAEQNTINLAILLVCLVVMPSDSFFWWDTWWD